MNKLTAIGTTILGILMILGMVGIEALGTLTSGILGWVIAIIVTILGFEALIRKFKQEI